jgi:hypothetical protein
VAYRCSDTHAFSRSGKSTVYHSIENISTDMIIRTSQNLFSSLIYTNRPRILVPISNYPSHPSSKMQIINLFGLLGLQALITTTLAQSALLERQSDDDASCLDTYYNTAYCCSDTIADCDDGTFPKPHYSNLKYQADVGVCCSQCRPPLQI